MTDVLIHYDTNETELYSQDEFDGEYNEEYNEEYDEEYETSDNNSENIIDANEIEEIDTLNISNNEDCNEEITQSIFDIALSDEQQNICDEIIHKNSNVIINAVAGSGKTTTILGLAHQLLQNSDNRDIIMITYNRELKDEVCDKVKKYKLTNIKIHTYHSFAYAYFGKQDMDYDQALIDIVEKQKPKIGFCKFIPILVIDEVQDMIDIYYNFIKYVMTIFEIKQLILAGDEKQCVYAFKKANSQYLTNGGKFFDRIMIELNLKISYRVTKQIATFINDICLGYEKLISNKEGPVIQYKIMNVYNLEPLINDIKSLIVNKIYKPDDIFILNCTVNSDSSHNPLYNFANKLVNKGIPLYVSNNKDIETKDISLLNGKVCFSTHCGSKGRERPLVIIFGYDSSYFTYYGKTTNPDIIPDNFYVALTRAKKELWIISNEKSQSMPFHKKSELEFDCSIVHIDGFRTKQKDNNRTSPVKDEHVNITDIVRNIDPMINYKIINIINEISQVVQQKSFTICATDIVNSNVTNEKNNTKEYISDITGNIMPELFMDSHNKSLYKPLLNNEYTRSVVIDMILFNNEEDLHNSKIMFEDKRGKGYKFIIIENSIYQNTAAVFYSNKNTEYINKITIQNNDMCNLEDMKIIKNSCVRKHVFKDIYDFNRDIKTYVICENEKNIEIIKFINRNNIHNYQFKQYDSSYLTYISQITTLFHDGDAYHNRLAQIKTFDWITQDMRRIYIERMSNIINRNNIENIKNEYLIRGIYFNYKANCSALLKLAGRIDMIQDDTLFELKFVGSLNITHKCQLILYMYLCNKLDDMKNITNFYLFNVADNELIKINNDKEKIKQIAEIILDNYLSQN